MANHWIVRGKLVLWVLLVIVYSALGWMVIEVFVND